MIKETARLESMVKDMLDLGRHLEIRPKKTDLMDAGYHKSIINVSFILFFPQKKRVPVWALVSPKKSSRPMKEQSFSVQTRKKE